MGITLITILTLSLLVILLLVYFSYKHQLSKNKVQVQVQEQVQDPVQSKIFIFDFTVVDPVTFVSRSLRAKMTLKNIELFLNPGPIGSQRSYKLNKDDLSQNLSVNFVDISKSIYEFNPQDKLNPNMYEIKNKYFLMDPFLTSGKDMIITDEMKYNFNNVVIEKSKQKDVDYHL